ncbi:hypothetical protein SAMN02745866_03480 [Alteromonadaceae bacterium Bs31]|nr:hypothetical protein SAMN02745866_03480 [Alteromonadaceae bacterium Bs31]
MNARNTTTLLLLTLTLLACGGGGSGSAGSNTTNTVKEQPASIPSSEPVDTVAPTPAAKEVDYQADKALLSSDAADSTELYVEEAFNFDQVREVSFEINARDKGDLPLTNKLVKIKSVPSDLSSWDDSRLSNAQLILVTKTNEQGEAFKTLEMPSDVEKVLVQINALGLENQALISINGDAPLLVEHTFK